jgi:hypothetical protein
MTPDELKANQYPGFSWTPRTVLGKRENQVKREAADVESEADGNEPPRKVVRLEAEGPDSPESGCTSAAQRAPVLAQLEGQATLHYLDYPTFPVAPAPPAPARKPAKPRKYTTKPRENCLRCDKSFVPTWPLRASGVCRYHDGKVIETLGGRIE